MKPLQSIIATKMRKALRKLGPAACILGMTAATLTAFAPDASAVPSYSRRYGMECSGCHTMWGALNGAGVQFRLSGYRAIAGKNLTPISEDIEISKGVVIPTTLPLSFITGVGFDYINAKTNVSNGTNFNSTGSSIDLEDASIFLTSPLGKHLSAFVEFPMYETQAWDFPPTLAQAIANGNNKIQFPTESPSFEVAKFFWNNLLPEGTVPRDSFNLLGGITHPPLAYSPGKVRLSVNQYLIYVRRGLDLISPKPVNDMLGDANDSYFRLSEPQVLAEVFGMVVPGAEVTDVSKRETFWFEYHAGVSNGSNGHADNNTNKDLYARFVMRWYNQTLGGFYWYSPNIYGDAITTNASIANGGILSGATNHNTMSRAGVDFTLSAVPLGAPVWLDNQFMWNHENNPTEFNTGFGWRGGFSQLNWQPSKDLITYARYEYVRGDQFNDTTAGGITHAQPKQQAIVAGLQYLIDQNVKLIGEYQGLNIKNNAGPADQQGTLKTNGFTLRVMLGF